MYSSVLQNESATRMCVCVHVYIYIYILSLPYTLLPSPHSTSLGHYRAKLSTNHSTHGSVYT